MIACYAWTDIQIINLLNVRASSFKNEKADLFVFMLKRINPKLLEIISQSNCFENIYKIPYVGDDVGHKFLWNVPYCKGLLTTLYRKKYYADFYKESIGEASYDYLLTPGYWGETLHLVRHLMKNNSGIKVAFVEEGSRHYSASSEVLCRNQLIGGKRQNLIKYIVLGKEFAKADMLPKQLFLYEPRARLSSIDLTIESIPKITKKNKICYDCIDALRCGKHYEEYQNRDVYYFTGADNDQDEKYRCITNEILRCISEEVPQNKVLLKQHPTDIEPWKPDREQNEISIWVDPGSELFESIIPDVDITNKVLISKNTSCFFSAKYIFDAEPVLVYVYRLYSHRKPMEDYYMNLYVKGLRRIYREPWKVMDVGSMDELRECLKQIYENK